MEINKLELDPGAAIYYDEGLRVVMEDHMESLRKHPTTTMLDVDAGTAYKYEHDLYGLLRRYNIPIFLHWLTMRLNNLTAPFDYTQDLTLLYLPDPTVVGRIVQSHQSTRKIT